MEGSSHCGKSLNRSCNSILIGASLDELPETLVLRERSDTTVDTVQRNLVACRNFDDGDTVKDHAIDCYIRFLPHSDKSKFNERGGRTGACTGGGSGGWN